MRLLWHENGRKIIFGGKCRIRKQSRELTFCSGIYSAPHLMLWTNRNP